MLSSENKFGLAIYVPVLVSAERIVTDHIGSFKSALLELFIKNLRLDFQKLLKARKPS